MEVGTTDTVFFVLDISSTVDIIEKLDISHFVGNKNAHKISLDEICKKTYLYLETWSEIGLLISPSTNRSKFYPISSIILTYV